MFNSKRIIFLIGLLSLVTLTGALLAGPAFAKGPKSGVCHYQDAQLEWTDEVTGEFHEAEDAGWVEINISDSGLPAHLGDGEVEAHNDGNGYTDMLIDNGEVAAENTTSSTACEDRNRV